MGTQLNRHAYERLVEEDIGWLEKQPHSLERMHILDVLRWSVEALYRPLRHFQSAVLFDYRQVEQAINRAVARVRVTDGSLSRRLNARERSDLHTHILSKLEQLSMPQRPKEPTGDAETEAV